MTDLVAEGRHRVTPVEWGISKTKAGKPMPFITFSNGLTWFGSLNEGKAREITVNALVTCGFAYDDLKLLDRPDALDTTTEVSIVVSHEDYEGVTRAKVNWVNKLASFKVDKTEATELLAGIDLKGHFMAEFQEQGITKKTPTTPIQTFDTSDIPF